MKQKRKVTLKLNLNKETIASLGTEEQSKIYGGQPISNTSHCVECVTDCVWNSCWHC